MNRTSRIEAAAGLRRLTRAVRWVVLDVETTDSDTGKHIVSVGIHQWRNDPTEAQPVPPPLEWFVEPGVPIENSRIHRITNALLEQQQAPPFAAYQPQLDRVLTPRPGETVVLVAHYARFDVGVLHLEYQRLGTTLPDMAVLDTYELAKWLNVGATRYNLPSLLAHYGLALTHHHDAAADAADTTALLHKLLAEAADQGVTDFGVAHPDSGKPAALHRTADYPAAEPRRGLRARRRSPFIFIDRPADHQRTHKALPKNPTTATLDSWLADARSCLQLRCPALPDKADGLRHDRDRMADAFLHDWQAFQARGEQVSANTALGAALVLLPKAIATADAPGWLTRWEPQLRQTTRCVRSAATPQAGDPSPVPPPTDACPDCRADRGCPADRWHLTAAMLLLGAGRNFNATNSKAWLTPSGRLSQLRGQGHRDLAGHAAWLLYEMLANTCPAKARDMAALADKLGLTHPHLTYAVAAEAELAGDPDSALTRIEHTLTTRNGSSDEAWTDLLTLRAAIQARQIAAARVPQPREYRIGHSAPEDRPDRRRFQLPVPAHATGSIPAGLTPSAPKALARKRRAARAGR